MYLPQSDDRVGNSSQIALDSLAQHSCLPAFGNASYLSPLPALLRCCKCRPWPKSPGPTKLAADWRTLVIRVSFDRTSASRRSEIEWCLQKSWRKEKRLDKKKKENTKREIFLYIRKRSAAHVLSITYRLKNIQNSSTVPPVHHDAGRSTSARCQGDMPRHRTNPEWRFYLRRHLHEMAPKRHVERKRRSSLIEQGFLLENFLFPAKNPSLEKNDRWTVVKN